MTLTETKIVEPTRKHKPFLWGSSSCQVCGADCDIRSKRCRNCFRAARQTGQPKVCTSCKLVLPRTNFYIRSTGEPLPRCKQCCPRFERKVVDPVGFKAWSSEYTKRPMFKDKRNKRIAERSKIDVGFVLSRDLRASIHDALRRKQQKRTGRTVRFLGCSIEHFKRHIEAQWRPGMSWDNRGRGFGFWQLDHIRPISSFDLSVVADQLACFHFSNYQSLWSEENAEKSDFLNWVPSQRLRDMEGDRLAFISRGLVKAPTENDQPELAHIRVVFMGHGARHDTAAQKGPLPATR